VKRAQVQGKRLVALVHLIPVITGKWWQLQIKLSQSKELNTFMRMTREMNTIGGPVATIQRVSTKNHAACQEENAKIFCYRRDFPQVVACA
jgi:hypothetical protein